MVGFSHKVLALSSMQGRSSHPFRAEASKPLAPYASERLDRIERELEEVTSYFVKQRGRSGAFVKLSDRSPKDATTERGRCVLIY